jgi:hypothetical protein
LLCHQQAVCTPAASSSSFLCHQQATEHQQLAAAVWCAINMLLNTSSEQQQFAVKSTSYLYTSSYQQQFAVRSTSYLYTNR